MEVSKIVSEINGGSTVYEMAKDLGISKSKLSREINKSGYSYNKSTRKYDLISGEVKSVSVSPPVKKQSNTEFSLTSDEIRFVKDIYKRESVNDKRFEMTMEKSQLPPKKPDKKVPYIISEKTYFDFKSFSEDIENEYRISQNELVEIALQKLMRDFSK